MVGIETTRETTDKVRGAIFNLISFHRPEGIVLDLFSGSGAMGLEALSRGYDFAYFNDLNKKAYLTTKDNISALGYNSNSIITNLDYKRALEGYKKKFNIVFLDPPYKLDCCNEIINFIDENNLLEDTGLIVCEVELNTPILETNNLEIIKEREYGIRKVYVLRRRDFDEI
jgi:16S rRNA (guanine(966)-N(2))-methyltransferase RsmD